MVWDDGVLASLPDRAWEQGWWCVGKYYNYLLHKNRLMCTSFVCVCVCEKVLNILGCCEVLYSGVIFACSLYARITETTSAYIVLTLLKIVRRNWKQTRQDAAGHKITVP